MVSTESALDCWEGDGDRVRNSLCTVGGWRGDWGSREDAAELSRGRIVPRTDWGATGVVGMVWVAAIGTVGPHEWVASDGVTALGRGMGGVWYSMGIGCNRWIGGRKCTGTRSMSVGGTSREYAIVLRALVRAETGREVRVAL